MSVSVTACLLWSEASRSCSSVGLEHLARRASSDVGVDGPPAVFLRCLEGGMGAGGRDVLAREAAWERSA